MEPNNPIEQAQMEAAMLRGNPHFEAYLGYLDEVQEDILSRLANPADIGNHANLAYIAGALEVVRALRRDTGTAE